MVITIILLVLTALWLGADPVDRILTRRKVNKRRISRETNLTSVTGKVRTVVPPERAGIFRSSFKPKE